MINKPWYKRWLVWGLIALIVLVPIGIDKAYQIGAKEPNTFYSASDLLSYWGTLVGALAVLIALYKTIKHERSEREKSKNRK